GTPSTRNPALPTLLIVRGFGLMFVFRSGGFLLVMLIAINITNKNHLVPFFFLPVPLKEKVNPKKKKPCLSRYVDQMTL
ncbi:hypothetical protein, partial [Spiroplasma poulsonii]|uniref:hypothetical protein n=1 Tax=Spiroplasma poulsonii TaxID=2138 RepID=UPI001D15AD01